MRHQLALTSLAIGLIAMAFDVLAADPPSTPHWIRASVAQDEYNKTHSVTKTYAANKPNHVTQLAPRPGTIPITLLASGQADGIMATRATAHPDVTAAMEAARVFSLSMPAHSRWFRLRRAFRNHPSDPQARLKQLLLSQRKQINESITAEILLQSTAMGWKEILKKRVEENRHFDDVLALNKLSPLSPVVMQQATLAVTDAISTWQNSGLAEPFPTDKLVEKLTALGHRSPHALIADLAERHVLKSGIQVARRNLSAQMRTATIAAIAADTNKNVVQAAALLSQTLKKIDPSQHASPARMTRQQQRCALTIAAVAYYYNDLFERLNDRVAHSTDEKKSLPKRTAITIKDLYNTNGLAPLIAEIFNPDRS